MIEGLAGFDTQYKNGLVGPVRQVPGWGEVGKRVEQLPPAVRGRPCFRLLGRNRSDAGLLKTFASSWPIEIDVDALPTGGKGFALVRGALS